MERVARKSGLCLAKKGKGSRTRSTRFIFEKALYLKAKAIKRKSFKVVLNTKRKKKKPKSD